MARKQHHVRKTLLVVGEGASEEAFLKHLRELYCAGGTGVAATVRNAHGKGPENVIAHAIRQATIYDYDQCVALLDTDLPWSDPLKKAARKAKIHMIGSSPCFEGLLLAILEKRPATQCAECKKAMQQLLHLDLTERQSYVKHFSKTVLDAARLKISPLDQLLTFFEGH